MYLHTKQLKNDNYFTAVDYFTCDNCQSTICEADQHVLISHNVHLCLGCIRSLFFATFDLYSIPLMPEVQGFFRYTLKARGQRQALPREIREKVFRKNKYTCQNCGAKNKKHLTVDHIHPYSKGGPDIMANFQTLCRSCNSKKNNKIL